MSVLDSGQRVGRYRIVRFLGAGAMGEVYLAEDPHIERRLAIKTVRLAGGRPADIEDRKRRLLREARAAGRLLHPNVVALFDAGEEEGLLYLAFEFVEGCDLASRLETGPPPSLREVLRIVRQVADALDYAHRQGIVHRDIKPSNILIDAAGHVKVADFGIAKVTGQNTELTVAGSVMGSPQYLSPEQIRGDELDGRSDIFSLGVVLYELLSGRRPFDGETITTLVYQILHKDVSISELRSVPLRLDQLLHHMLAKDREERLATAGLVAEELAAIERELPEAVLSAPAAPASDMLDATRVMPSRTLTPPGTPPARSTPPAGIAVSGSGQQAMPSFQSTANGPGIPGSQSLTPTTATAPPISGSSGAYGIPAAHGTSSAIGSGAVPTAAGVFAPPPPVPVAVSAAAPFVGGIPPAAPPGAQAQQPSYPTYPQGPPPAATASARSSNGKIWLLVGGLLLVFFAVVAAGGYWVWTRYLHATSDGGQAAAGVPSGTAPDSGTANPSHLADGGLGASGASGAGGAKGPGVTGGSSSTSQIGQSGAAGQPGTQTAGDAASAAARANANPGNSATGAAGPFGQPTNSAGPFGSGGPTPAGPAGAVGSVTSGGTSSAPSTSQPYPPTTPTTPSGRPGYPGSSGYPAGTTRQAGPGAPYTPPGRPPVYVPPPPQPPVPGTAGTPGASGAEESAGSANAGRSGRGRRPVETAPSGDGDESAEVGDVTVTPSGPAADRVLRSGLELAFRVNPPDAYVLLDGGVIGRAEEWNGQKGARSYTLPSTGTHIIKIKKPGMKEYRIALEASATRGVTPIFVNLQPLPSAQVEVTDLETIHVREAIALHVQPDVAAVVLVDGSTAGPAKKFGGRFGHGDEWLSLPIGMHRVTLIAPSFKRKDLAVDVSPGADKARQKIDVSLVPETGH